MGVIFLPIVRLEVVLILENDNYYVSCRIFTIWHLSRWLDRGTYIPLLKKH